MVYNYGNVMSNVLEMLKTPCTDEVNLFIFQIKTEEVALKMLITV